VRGGEVLDGNLDEHVDELEEFGLVFVHGLETAWIEAPI
jgi:hypothetical protein